MDFLEFSYFKRKLYTDFQEQYNPIGCILYPNTFSGSKLIALDTGKFRQPDFKLSLIEKMVNKCSRSYWEF